MPHNNRMQLTRSAPLQGRLAPPSQLIRVFDERYREQGSTEVRPERSLI